MQHAYSSKDKKDVHTCIIHSSEGKVGKGASGKKGAARLAASAGAGQPSSVMRAQSSGSCTRPLSRMARVCSMGALAARKSRAASLIISCSWLSRDDEEGAGPPGLTLPEDESRGSPSTVVAMMLS